MKKLSELTKEINDLTLKMEQEYPELYKYLDENPITISWCDHSNVDSKSLADYLDNLKQLLAHHIESHQVRNKN